jgi:hypothetical protein
MGAAALDVGKAAAAIKAAVAIAVAVKLFHFLLRVIGIDPGSVELS